MKSRNIFAALVATTLGLGGALIGTLPALADDAVIEETKAPDVGYGLALWSVDDDGGDPLWPQTLVSYTPQAEPDLNGLDSLATECGTTYQADLYRDDDTTAALVAIGHLYAPGDPAESWPGDGYQDSYSKVWTTEPCVEEPPVEEPPVYVTPTECEAFTTLPLATEENPAGWGDTKGGTWTEAGLLLTAGVEEAYAYLDLFGDDQYLLSTSLNGLETVYGSATGSFGVIIHTDKANVHYDADGLYWTTTAGVFPETHPGFYSTYDLAELIQDATIDSVAVWVNPGGSLLLQSQAYNCLIQPFGAEPVTEEPPVVVDPPTEEPPVVEPPVVDPPVVVEPPTVQPTVLVEAAAELPNTGSTIPTTALGFGAFLLMLGGAVTAAVRLRKN
jgi:LPXTG-motif cell wall-anchored protein